MARPLRVEFAGANYHVMNRGNRRQVVFASDHDNELFLEKLAEFSETFNVSVMSYCLMVNHFHLYLRTNEANLSRFMQSLLTSFTVAKNRRERSSGHLFQGRFKSVLAEDEIYGGELSRYIHLNPIRTESVRAMDAKSRRSVLRDYRWSSYGQIIGLRRRVDWLATGLLIKRWGNTDAARRQNYSKYVEEGVLRDIPDPMEAMDVRAVLGSESFLEKVRRGFADIGANLNILRELGEKRRFAARVDLDAMAVAVSNAYAVPARTLFVKNSRGNQARQVFLFLASTHCRGRYSLTELAGKLGGITVGGLTRSRYNVLKASRSDRKLRNKIAEIEESITPLT
jgi:REP element-mobilizing transposase RayT